MLLKSTLFLRDREKDKQAKNVCVDSLKGLDKDMLKMMGFATFDTTKNKRVAGNSDGAVSINKPRRYRQYMNRKGGFNRPLDYVA
ncbi:unnamed protein product [Thelazia callipaeda]|uniref:U4/U6.U5 small nuclear ribonucleoprotein 27 kDa protein n=1 Tax=Thelazia callipaeda TaxID=103827 RepID=A0A0N5D7T6_THECL|nr:unnamed protein product [Thelazia callipaeda]